MLFENVPSCFTVSLLANLQAARTGRVMVLTTHFMDEADILGDRIGIMAKGELHCCGSSLFLKSRYGGGYNLAFSKRTTDAAEPLQALVTGRIAGAKVLSNIGTELKFQLPLSQVASHQTNCGSFMSKAGQQSLMSLVVRTGRQLRRTFRGAGGTEIQPGLRELWRRHHHDGRGVPPGRKRGRGQRGGTG